MFWDEKDIALLRSLYGQGLSAREIAARLGNGYTRSAILGKAHRLKLPGRSAPTSDRQSQRRQNQLNKAPKKPPVFKVEPFVAAVVNETPTRKLETLEAGECRWPIGEPGTEAFGFCGCKAVMGLPYCESHRKRAYRTFDVIPRKDTDKTTVPAGERAREDEGVS